MTLTFGLEMTLTLRQPWPWNDLDIRPWNDLDLELTFTLDLEMISTFDLEMTLTFDLETLNLKWSGHWALKWPWRWNNFTFDLEMTLTFDLELHLYWKHKRSRNYCLQRTLQSYWSCASFISPFASLYEKLKSFWRSFSSKSTEKRNSKPISEI